MARTWSAWAEAGRAEGMESRHRVTAGPVLDSLPLNEGTRLLDLGCGNAWASRHAAARGASAVGIDVAPSMLVRARAAGASVALASFEHLPFPDATFDLAWSMESLYYATALDRALAEVARVLAPGGSLHTLIDFYEENEASHPWPDEVGVPMHLLSEAAWARCLERAGFDDVRTERVRPPAGAGGPEVDAWVHEVGSLYVTGRLPTA